MMEKQNAIVSGLGRSYRRLVILLVPGRSVGLFLIVNPERVRPLRHGGAAPPIYSMSNMLMTGTRINIEWRRRAARIGARVKRDPAMGVQIYKLQTANLAADLRVTIAMRAFAEQRYAALNLRTLHLHRPGTKGTRPSYVRTQHVSGRRYGRLPRHTAKRHKSSRL